MREIICRQCHYLKMCTAEAPRAVVAGIIMTCSNFRKASLRERIIRKFKKDWLPEHLCLSCRYLEDPKCSTRKFRVFTDRITTNCSKYRKISQKDMITRRLEGKL